MGVVRVAEQSGASISEIDYASSESMELHAHPELCISLILRGAIDERIGSTELRGAPFTISVKLPGSEHQVRFSDGQTQTIKIKINTATLAEWGVEVRDLTALNWVLNARPLRSMVTALMKLRHCYDRTDAWVPDMAAEVLGILIDDLSTRRLDHTPLWLMSAREELRADFVNGVRVTRIAQSVGVNRVTLARGFRLYFGCTPSDYVRQLRIEKAVALLARGDNAVTVALAVGCADQSHLARILRHDVGITPRQVRTLNFR